MIGIKELNPITNGKNWDYRKYIIEFLSQSQDKRIYSLIMIIVNVEKSSKNVEQYTKIVTPIMILRQIKEKKC